jgi:hypothetical protein
LEEKNEATQYVTLFKVPTHIHETVKLWKPFLGRTINQTYIDILQYGIKHMRPVVEEHISTHLGIKE